MIFYFLSIETVKCIVSMLTIKIWRQMSNCRLVDEWVIQVAYEWDTCFRCRLSFNFDFVLVFLFSADVRSMAEQSETHEIVEVEVEEEVVEEINDKDLLCRAIKEVIIDRKSIRGTQNNFQSNPRSVPSKMNK